MTTSPRPQRLLGFAGAAGLGLLTLAGCSGAADADTGSSSSSDTSSSSSDTGSSSSSTSSDTSSSSSGYTDGTYTAEGSYLTPGGEETIEVEITLEDGIVTAVTVTPEATDAKAESFQEEFADGIADVVVGVSIDELDVSRVAGSSLTSEGFAEAIETIKSEAAA
ncbi:MAG: hypothetical protein QM675_01540 [Protaetiibacter sp.]